MKKIILILSVLIFVMPFLGFPDSFKTFFYIVFSATIAFIVYKDDIQSFFSVQRPPEGIIIKGDSYVESVGPAKVL